MLIFQSYKVSSQSTERPGLSKYLKHLSDSNWDESKDILQKFFQREGKFEKVQKSNFETEVILQVLQNLLKST